jgi:hypothetical protein
MKFYQAIKSRQKTCDYFKFFLGITGGLCFLIPLLLQAGTALGSAPQFRLEASPALAAAFPPSPASITQSSPVPKEVRGTVRDSTGVLPGVVITLKGNPKIGTATDVNGKFLLEVPDANAILIFRMVGYLEKEVPLAGKEIFDVRLQVDAKQLGEVVVVAFGKQKRPI